MGAKNQIRAYYRGLGLVSKEAIAETARKFGIPINEVREVVSEILDPQTGSPTRSGKYASTNIRGFDETISQEHFDTWLKGLLRDGTIDELTYNKMKDSATKLFESKRKGKKI